MMDHMMGGGMMWGMGLFGLLLLVLLLLAIAALDKYLFFFKSLSIRAALLRSKVLTRYPVQEFLSLRTAAFGAKRKTSLISFTSAQRAESGHWFKGPSTRI